MNNAIVNNNGYEPSMNVAIATKEEENVLRHNLDRAMKLGNLYNESVRLRFVNDSGAVVDEEAFVLTVTERYVVLRGGMSVPIKALREVIIL